MTRKPDSPTPAAQFSLFDLWDAPTTVAVIASPTAAPESEDAPPPLTLLPTFRFTAETFPVGGSPLERARRNLAALRLLPEAEARGFTSEQERATVSAFCGWGAAPQAFDDASTGAWEDVHNELQRVLTPTAYNEARQSILSAFYTPVPLASAIWRLAEHLGYTGGTTLDPACGTGIFLGTQPAHLAEASEWRAVEIESISARIAQTLFPDAWVHACGFEDVRIRERSVDLVVGNVPYGDWAVHDPVYNPDRFSIHDYFLLKSLHLLRPGALLLALTSRYTLDKASPDARAAMYEVGDLVAAFRLPHGTFQDSAGTEAPADLLVMRRRSTDEAPGDATWLESLPTDVGGETISINATFQEHPNRILGQMHLASGRFGPELRITGPVGDELAEALLRQRDELPTAIWTPERTEQHVAPVAPDAALRVPEGVKEGAFFLHEGELYVNDEGLALSHGLRYRRDVDRVKALVLIRDRYDEVIAAQLDAQPSPLRIRETRQDLHEAYDAFVSRFGPINLTGNAPEGRTGVRINLRAFLQDPDAMRVAALEDYDPATKTATKREVFHKQLLRCPVRRIQADNAHDALLLVLDACARVDLERVARVWQNHTVEETIAALGDRIYHDPVTRTWQTDDEYLSGHVRSALELAQAAASEDPRYERNVAALTAVQPPPLTPAEIDAALGAPWIPIPVYETFIRALLGASADGRSVEIAHLPGEASWAVSADHVLESSVDATRAWGTERAGAIRLIEDALNQRATEIHDTYTDADGKRKTRKNATETIAAQEKQAAIKERFARWIWEDPDRMAEMVERYNRIFGGWRLREWNGSYLTFQGLSDAITPDDHQLNFVARGLAGNALAGHCVGAGKTLSSILLAMKVRELGLATRIWMVTLNHMLESYAAEFYRAFPAAKLLIATAEDFDGDRRRLFLARALSGDYDAVILTQSAFGKIRVSREREQAFLEDKIATYVAMCEEAKGKRLSQKEAAKARKRYEARLEALLAQDRDDHVTFEQLSIQMLVVDEIHCFKNLDTPTKQRGIPRASRPSQRAMDLWMKGHVLDEIRPGWGFIGMTATPLANTIAEALVMLLYHAPALLQERGIEHFDAFAAIFIKPIPSLELAPDGNSYRLRTRFFFQNVGELVALFRHVVDVQVAESYYGNRSDQGDDPFEDVPAHLHRFIGDLHDPLGDNADACDLAA